MEVVRVTRIILRPRKLVADTVMQGRQQEPDRDVCIHSNTFHMY